MSILAQSLRRPKIKPKWQAPLGVMESVVAYNCRKHGFPIPVLALPFWEGAGNKVYDVSGKMNHGTLINGAKWVAGMRSGTALQFDGVNDYVNCGNAPSLNPTVAITMAVWVKPSVVTTTYGKIISKPTSNTISDDPWNLYVLDMDNANPGHFRFGISTGSAGSGVLATSITTVTANKWYHVVGTYNGSQLKIYINGINEANTSSTITIGTANTNLIISRFASAINSNYFNGIIDGVRIYNRALTAAQIKYLYDNPYFMYEMPEELWGYTAAAAVWAIRDVIGGGVVPFKR